LCIAIAIALTLHGTGPLWLSPYTTTHDRILALQLFVLAALGIAFPINALQAQRDRLPNLLREGEHRYRTLAENSDDVVMQLSLDGVMKYISSRAKLMLGYGSDELLGRSVGEFVHPDDRVKVEDAVDVAAREQSDAAVNFRMRRNDGAYVWVQGFLSALFDISGNAFSALVFTIRDVHARTLDDQRRDAEQLELARLAYNDGLSGLYNRRHFDIELERRMSPSAFSESTTVVLLLVDTDNFKAYNDCYGHQAGDACLQRVANTLVTAVRSNDVAARCTSGGINAAIESRYPKYGVCDPASKVGPRMVAS
jgi:PAS domain S-box-containing protein